MLDPLILIAAGGAGSRLGGNKPLARLGGRRLIDHALAYACGQGDMVMLSAPAAIAGVMVPHLPDSVPGLGPIGALLAGMQAAAALGRERLLLIGCDMPFLPGDLLARLAAALPEPGAVPGAALPISRGHVQPLAGLWRVEVAALGRFVASGGRSVRAFAEARGLATVAWPADGPDPFASINTPADLAEAEHRLKTARLTPAR